MTLTQHLKKAGRKVNALSRTLMLYQEHSDLKTLVFRSEFNFCALVWALRSRTINNKINYLRERCLLMVYSDKITSFKKLLETDRSVPIHIRNSQILAT